MEDTRIRSEEYFMRFWLHAIFCEIFFFSAEKENFFVLSLFLIKENVLKHLE